MKFKDTSYGDLSGKTVGSIILRDKDITDLEGFPKEVTAMVQITNTQPNKGLTSLEGMASKVVNIIVWGNQLSSLKGSPKYVKQDMDCSNNPLLRSLEGAPKEVENFTCMHIGIKTKEELVYEILKSGMKVKNVVVSDFDNFRMTDKDDEVVQKVKTAFELKKKTDKKLGKFKDFLEL